MENKPRGQLILWPTIYEGKNMPIIKNFSRSTVVLEHVNDEPIVLKPSQSVEVPAEALSLPLIRHYIEIKKLGLLSQRPTTTSFTLSRWTVALSPQPNFSKLFNHYQMASFSLAISPMVRMNDCEPVDRWNNSILILQINCQIFLSNPCGTSLAYVWR